VAPLQVMSVRSGRGRHAIGGPVAFYDAEVEALMAAPVRFDAAGWPDSLLTFGRFQHNFWVARRFPPEVLNPERDNWSNEQIGYVWHDEDWYDGPGVKTVGLVGFHTLARRSPDR